MGALTGWVAVVPVKSPQRAKTRLGDMPAAVRSDLARAFALDLISALIQCEQIEQVLVISEDRRFQEEAEATGCITIADSTKSLNEAIDLAISTLPTRGESVSRPVAVFVSDLPCATPESISGLLRDASLALTSVREGPNMVFARDHLGVGTTFLGARNPNELRPLFGQNSAASHKGAGAQELRANELSMRVRLDVDTQDDLNQAIALGVGRHTQKALE